MGLESIAHPVYNKNAFLVKYMCNPLKDALDEVLKSDELKEHLRKLIMEVYEEVSKEVDFKIFVKEAVVRQVIDQLQK